MQSVQADREELQDLTGVVFIWDEARRIIERYRVPGEVDDYLARWKTEPRVLVTVTPERISTRATRR